MPQPEYQDDGVSLYCGDSIEVMRTLPESGVDTVITDPPYGLEFMGKEWDKLTWNDETSHRGKERQHGANVTSHDYGMRICRGINRMIGGTAAQDWHQRWATAALRVAKPGAMLLAFGGTRTFHRLTCAIEDAGWEIRDCLMWLYGSGFPKSLNISKAFAMRPANGRGAGINMEFESARSRALTGASVRGL